MHKLASWEVRGQGVPCRRGPEARRTGRPTCVKSANCLAVGRDTYSEGANEVSDGLK